MANPVQQQPVPPQQAPAPIAAPRPPAPRGLGAAPSRLEQPPAPAEKGYILSAVAWIKNFLVSVWDWLCVNIWGVPPRPAQQPPAVPPAPGDQEARAYRDLQQRLHHIRQPAEMVRILEQHYDDELEREEVFAEIGRAAPHVSWGNLFQSWRTSPRDMHIHVGKQMVERSPSLLIGPILRKAHQRAHP